MTSQNTRFALISVSDKTGVAGFAQRLVKAGFSIISTGGTAQHLRESGVQVTEVQEITGFPEMLDGRVKTLHPKIHGGVLADRANRAHAETMIHHQIPNIEVVAVNLYPFEQVTADASTPWDVAIENIDIGGPTLLRAAAKNHNSVLVVVEPSDFDAVAKAVESGSVDTAYRRKLAWKAFRHTASYDACIESYFHARLDNSEGEESHLPRVAMDLVQTEVLRYGENPHQEAALYRLSSQEPYGGVEQLHGKQLSYNNIVDLDAALALVAEFDSPAVAIIKHTNPAGCAQAGTIESAYQRALSADPISAFGGIVAVNRAVTRELASALNEHFYEIIAAPEFDSDALSLLQTKKNLRLLRWPETLFEQYTTFMRSTALGLLMQENDERIALELSALEVPTQTKPNEDQLQELLFAWKVCKHVKSNAIVLSSKGRTLGVGAGQMSRVDSVELAVRKSRENLQGSVMASDAFFPFRDGIDAAARAGVVAVIQPGGSKRDEEVVAACDEHGLSMVFTGQRHFRH